MIISKQLIKAEHSNHSAFTAWLSLAWQVRGIEQAASSVIWQRVNRFFPMTLGIGWSSVSYMIIQLGEHAKAWWLNPKNHYYQTDVSLVFLRTPPGQCPVQHSINDGDDFLECMQLQLGHSIKLRVLLIL